MPEVYWIHLPEHVDMAREGYIGVTNRTTSDRFKEHLYNYEYWLNGNRKGCNHLYNAMSKYGKENIIVETIFTSECYQEVLDFEFYCRPNPMIGWNIAIGGQPNPMLGREVTDEIKKNMSAAQQGRPPASKETRDKISGFHKGKIVSNETRKRMSEAQKKRKRKKQETPTFRNSSSLSYVVWQNADKYWNIWNEDNSIGCRKLAKKLGSPYLNAHESLIKYFRLGWIPNEDLMWKEVYHPLV